MITWKLDLEQAEYYLDLMEAERGRRSIADLSPDVGLNDDIRWLRQEIEDAKASEDEEL